MSNDFITVLNTVSGLVGEVPASYLTHPHFKNQLVPVADGQKPYNSALYVPKTADEFREVRKPVAVEAVRPTSAVKPNADDNKTTKDGEVT